MSLSASFCNSGEHWVRIITKYERVFDYREREGILTFYEHLEKLLEASYLVYNDRKEQLKKLHHQLLEEELRDD